MSAPFPPLHFKKPADFCKLGKSEQEAYRRELLADFLRAYHDKANKLQEIGELQICNRNDYDARDLFDDSWKQYERELREYAERNRGRR